LQERGNLKVSATFRSSAPALFMKNIMSSKTIFYIISITLLAVFLVSILPLNAQAIKLDDIFDTAKDAGLAVQFKSFEDIFLVILQVILSLSFITAVTFVVISGFNMMTSRGDEEKLTKAKGALLWAIIGIILIALSWFIVIRLTNLITESKTADTSPCEAGPGNC